MPAVCARVYDVARHTKVPKLGSFESVITTSLIDRSVKVTKRGSAIVTCLVTVEGDIHLLERNDKGVCKKCKKGRCHFASPQVRITETRKMIRQPAFSCPKSSRRT